MATNILTKEVKGTNFSPLEAGLIATSKIATETLLSRVAFIGNGTIKSGIIKIVGAGALGSMIKGNVSKIVATGLMVDGGEDVVRGLLGGTLGMGGQGSSEVGGNSANQGSGVGEAI